jgi:hypothetical protein
VAGEKQEMVVDQETLALLKRFSRDPGVAKARAEFEHAQRAEETFHKDFDGRSAADGLLWSISSCCWIVAEKLAAAFYEHVHVVLENADVIRPKNTTARNIGPSYQTLSANAKWRLNLGDLLQLIGKFRRISAR